MLNRHEALAVLGAGSGEGCSTVTVTVGKELAQKHNSVTLIVDANLRNPVLHKAFGIAGEPGLTDLLTRDGEVAYEETIRETSVPGLFVMPSGGRRENPEQVFGGENLDETLKIMRRNFEHVIFDGPPVNSCPEAVVLASHCDGVVLVVQSGETRREVILHARDILTNGGAKVLGVVLNKRKFYIPNFLYRWL